MERNIRIALLSMVNDNYYARQAFVNAYFQAYPNHLKHLYLIYDKGRKPLDAGSMDMPATHLLLERNVVDHSWWSLKLELFLKKVKEEISIWWDSDDLYEPEYMRKVRRFFEEHPDISFAWNRGMLDVNNEGVKFRIFNSGAGTLAFKNCEMKKAFSRFSALYPRRMFCSNAGRWLPLDSRFRKWLVQEYAVGEGSWLRGYFNHEGSFSAMENKTVRKETIKR